MSKKMSYLTGAGKRENFTGVEKIHLHSGADLLANA
jgi:hypothetical protein